MLWLYVGSTLKNNPNGFRDLALCRCTAAAGSGLRSECLDFGHSDRAHYYSRTACRRRLAGWLAPCGCRGGVKACACTQLFMQPIQVHLFMDSSALRHGPMAARKGALVGQVHPFANSCPIPTEPSPDSVALGKPF